jgi:hypothetical protein
MDFIHPDSRPTPESFVETYQPIFKMLLTSRPLQRKLGQVDRYFRLGKHPSTEAKNFREGVIHFYTLEGWDCDSGVCEVPFQLSIPFKDAEKCALLDLISILSELEIETDVSTNHLVFTMYGGIGIARLLGILTQHIKNKFPSLQSNLDTEVFFKTKKWASV